MEKERKTFEGEIKHANNKLWKFLLIEFRPKGEENFLQWNLISDNMCGRFWGVRKLQEEKSRPLFPHSAIVTTILIAGDDLQLEICAKNSLLLSNAISASLSHEAFRFHRAQCSVGTRRVEMWEKVWVAKSRTLLMNEFFLHLSLPNETQVIARALRHWFGRHFHSSKLTVRWHRSSPDPLQTAFHIKTDTQMRARMIFFWCLSNVTCADFQDLARRKKYFHVFSVNGEEEKSLLIPLQSFSCQWENAKNVIHR